VWGVFLAGKKMSERSEFFFKENEKATPQARPHSWKSGSPNYQARNPHKTDRQNKNTN
jgi:hypothetical protein